MGDKILKTEAGPSSPLQSASAKTENKNPKHPQELILLSQAHSALSQAKSIDDVKQLRDQAESIKAYVRKAKLGRNLLLDASLVKIQAERKLGLMLQQMQLAKSAPGNQYSKSNLPNGQDKRPLRLEELGISKSDSSRYQQIASIPDDLFQQYVQSHLDSEKELTTSALLRIAKQYQATLKPDLAPRHNYSGKAVDRLDVFVNAKIKFATVYADPPWPYRNHSSRAASKNHYPSMSMEALMAEPVSKIVADQAHLHLWTTNAFIGAALQLMQAWGFQYKSCFVWVKPQLGLGNYWRVSHEFLLLGVKGCARFRSRKYRSWQEIPRTEHSRKPPQIRQLIEHVSPGPYLELYARQTPLSQNWTTYGSQIE